uniref:Uncharacterized protein n=1 Tax=Tetraselmis sp. GSL018 TaxID=582737 RepID=A0A061R799_9CHLO
MKEEPSKGVKTEIASYTPGEGFTAVKSVPGASLSGQGKELWVLRLPLHFDSEQLQGSAFCFKRKASTGKLGTLRSSTGK